MRVDEVVEGVVVIHDFLSEAECAAYRERADQAGYGEAPINNGSAFVRMESVRNNERVMLDDMEEAARLWARMAPLLPASWQRIAVNWYDDTPAPMDPVGLNERLRIYRYLPGQYFKPHSDARFVRTRDEFSMLTVLLYLERSSKLISPKDGGSLSVDTNFLHRLLRPDLMPILMFLQVAHEDEASST